MARRPRPATSSSGSREQAGKLKNTPFKALAALRGRTAQRPRSDTAPVEVRAVPVPDPQTDAEDRELFLRQFKDVAPLPKQDHAEIDSPRPAPVPRAKTPETTAEPGPAHRHGDPLFAAYSDVTPIADTNRVVLDQPPRRRTVQAEAGGLFDKSASADGELGRVVLPADADLADPGTLFRLAARGAQQIDDRNRIELNTQPPAPKPLKREADERDALSESLSAPLTFEDRLDMGDEAAFLRPGLPRRVLTDLRRGRWVLQGQLDLHGLTRDEARDALAHFLTQSLQQGRRCIRVIHGKGLGSPGKISILKQLSRGWLAQREEILAFCQAGPHDGGGGALLVLMRAQNGTRR